MEGKFLEMQQQMRHDNGNLQDYIRDLKTWEKGIKRKDEALRCEDSSNSVDIPAVRNASKRCQSKEGHKLSKYQKKKMQSKVAPDTAKFGDYYQSWDNFDVDAACAELDDDDDSTCEDNREYDEDDVDTDADQVEDLVEHCKIQEGNQHKEKGNALFRNGQYSEAMECYSSGMNADPTNAILPSNRAMSYIKLRKFQLAEADCNTSIALDPSYIKAYSRRAAANTALGRLHEAQQDYRHIVMVEVGNVRAQSQLNNIDKILKQRQEAEKLKEQGVYNVIQAIYKPVKLRSKKPLKRVKIDEIGTPNAEGDNLSSSTHPLEHNNHRLGSQSREIVNHLDSMDEGVTGMLTSN